MRAQIAALAAAILLSACGQSTPADNAADALEDAADQSTPAASEVLDNAADAIRENGVSTNAADANGPVQDAVEDAANAQARAPS